MNSCQPNDCLYPNCGCSAPPMQTIFEKPSYREQLDYLSSLGDSVMIRAIKENVIAVRNHEKATHSKS
jgi:hypothetical protein